MTPSDDDLLLGTPRFDASASGSDDAERWRSLVAHHGAPAAATHVRGDFAVALRLTDGSVFMAVDRFAIRSLCYRVADGGVAFSGRADALAGPAPSLDHQALFDYLYFHVIPSPRTAFAAVRRLPAGHFALYKDGHLTVAPYWVPTFKAERSATLNDLRNEFLHLLRQSVRRQLGGGRPACFLSGGTDSSTVAGLVGEVGGQAAATFSIGFDAEGYDEMKYARLAARQFGCEHHEYYVTPDDLMRDMPRVAAAYDQPFGNSSALPAYLCALQAREAGFTRMLAGDGGDELFGGNTRYATQRIFGIYQRVPSFLRRGLLEPFFGLDLVARTPLLKKGSGYIRQANTPLPDRAQAFNLVRRLGYANVLAPGFLAGVDVASVVEQQGAVWALARCSDELDRHLAFDWRYTLAECDLPKVCGTTALAGVGVGFPMLDDDLVDFSVRLPAHFKLKGLRLRWFFKEALRGFLPDEIITKRKQGFGLPFGVWAVRHAGLREMAGETLNTLAQRGVIRPGFVHELLNRYLPEHPHYYGSLVWILMMLEFWLREHAPDFCIRA